MPVPTGTLSMSSHGEVRRKLLPPLFASPQMAHNPVLG
jgi:hypothetical protein